MANLTNFCQRFIKSISTYLVPLWSPVDSESETVRHMHPVFNYFAFGAWTPNGVVIFIALYDKENGLLTCVPYFYVWELDGNISEMRPKCAETQWDLFVVDIPSFVFGFFQMRNFPLSLRISVEWHIITSTSKHNTSQDAYTLYTRFVFCACLVEVK